MDAISYSYADKQAKRIKKFINDPDSTSGVVTVPKTIASGENITIPSGRVAVLPNVQIDGTLNVQGDVFIPSGATLSSVVEKVTSTDNAIVRFDGTTGKVQNSGVIIDDNNNVGIGVTPSAWYGGYTRAIEIGSCLDNGIIWSSLNLQHSHIGIGANFRVDNSMTPRYKDSYPASQYQQDLGRHTWFIAPSGTAGNAITWTNAMTLASSGNLLVGTSTDNGMDKLQINGNVLSKRRNNIPVGDTVDLRYITSNASTQLGTIGLGNSSAVIVEIQSMSGIHSFPIYSFGGNGISYTYNYMNPGTAAWVHSGGISMSFTEAGTSPNTYSFAVTSGNGMATIQATTYNSPYTITITRI